MRRWFYRLGVSVHAMARQEDAENPLKSRQNITQNSMKRFSLTTMTTLFLLLLVTGILAQTDPQAENLMNALKAKDQVNALNLVKNVKDANCKFENNVTFILVASLDGYLDVCKILIEKGADLNLQAANGATPLIIASFGGNAELVKLFLDKGAKLDVQSKNGATALIAASEKGHIEVIKLLLVKGANLDVQSSNGVTALMMASQNGHSDVIKLLLEKGAKTDLKSNMGQTAYDIAKDSNIKSLMTNYEKGTKSNNQKTSTQQKVNNQITTQETPNMLPASEDNDRITVATNVCKNFYADYRERILSFYERQGNKIYLTNEYPLIFELSDKLSDNSTEEKKDVYDNTELTYKIEFGKLLFTLEQSKTDNTTIKVEMKNGMLTPNTDNVLFNITTGNSIASSGYFVVNNKRVVFLNGGIIFNNNNSKGEYKDGTVCIYDGIKYVYLTKIWTKQ